MFATPRYRDKDVQSLFGMVFKQRKRSSTVFLVVIFDSSLLNSLAEDSDNSVQYCPSDSFSIPFIPQKKNQTVRLVATRRPCDTNPNVLIDMITLPFRLNAVEPRKPMPAKLSSGRKVDVLKVEGGIAVCQDEYGSEKMMFMLSQLTFQNAESDKQEMQSSADSSSTVRSINVEAVVATILSYYYICNCH